MFTTKSNRRHRSMQLAVESCEERIVPVAPVVAVPLKFLGEYAVSKVLDKVTGLGNTAEFREINQKLDQLTAAVGRIETNLDKLQVSNDRQTLYQITEKLKISKINSYWGTFNSFIDLKLKNTPADKGSVETLAIQIIEDLRTTVADFKDAFNGQRVASQPLMSAYSNVIKKTVTNKLNGYKSDPFLDSNYSKAMVDGFDYYTSEGVKAAILLANAYTYLGKTALANDVRTTLPTPYSKGAAKDQWTRQVNTLPKQMIPDFVMIDTGTNRAWSQFDIVVGGNNSGLYIHERRLYDTLPDISKVISYLDNHSATSPPSGLNSLTVVNKLKDAHRILVKSGIRFKWNLPNYFDLGNKSEFYTSRGFSNLYNSEVWMTNPFGPDFPHDIGFEKWKPGGSRPAFLDNKIDSGNAVFYASIKDKEFFV